MTSTKIPGATVNFRYGGVIAVCASVGASVGFSIYFNSNPVMIKASIITVRNRAI